MSHVFSRPEEKITQLPVNQLIREHGGKNRLIWAKLRSNNLQADMAELVQCGFFVVVFQRSRLSKDQNQHYWWKQETKEQAIRCKIKVQLLLCHSCKDRMMLIFPQVLLLHSCISKLYQQTKERLRIYVQFHCRPKSHISLSHSQITFVTGNSILQCTSKPSFIF